MFRFAVSVASAALVLGACSSESVTSGKSGAKATNDVSTSDMSAKDVTFADLGPDTWPDIAMADVVPDVLPDVAAADAPLDAAPDIAAADSSALPAWLSGTWRECTGTLTFTAKNTFSWTSAWEDCSASGTVTLHDGLCDLAVDATSTGCTSAPPSWMRKDLQVTATSDQLTFVNPALFQGLKRLVRTGVRESWDIVGSLGGAGTLHLCFDAAGTFYDGRWRSDQCSLLACGANVSQVLVVGSETHIWTQCVGGCPCAAILVAKQKTADAMSGVYNGASCDAVEKGTFTGKLGKFPGDP